MFLNINKAEESVKNSKRSIDGCENDISNLRSENIFLKKTVEDDLNKVAKQSYLTNCPYK